MFRSKLGRISYNPNALTDFCSGVYTQLSLYVDAQLEQSKECSEMFIVVCMYNLIYIYIYIYIYIIYIHTYIHTYIHVCMYVLCRYVCVM